MPLAGFITAKLRADRIPSSAASNGMGTTHTAKASSQNTSKHSAHTQAVFTVPFALFGREVWTIGGFTGLFRRSVQRF